MSRPSGRPDRSRSDRRNRPPRRDLPRPTAPPPEEVNSVELPIGPPPQLPDGGLRVVALGGIGEIGRNMTVFEYDGRLLVVDCGVLFPAEDAARRRPDPARPAGHRGPARRHRRGGAHPRPRGPHRRGAVAAAAAPGPAGRRLPVHPRADRGQVPGAPADPAPAGGARGQPADARAVATASTSRSTTPSRTRWPSPSAPRPGMVLHTGDIKLDQLPLDGRLTDLAGFSRLGDEGVDLFLVDSTNAEVPGFVIAEREIGPVLDGVFHRSPAADHRGLLRLPRAPGAAGARRRGGARPPGRLVGRSMVRNMGLAAELGFLQRAGRPAGRPGRGDGAADEQLVLDLHRLAGRAAVRAVPDGPRRAPLGAHPQPRTRSSWPPR